MSFVEFVGPNHALQLFGVRLVGANVESAKKLLFTVALVIIVLAASKLLRGTARRVTAGSERTAFWVRQGIHLATALFMVVGFASIWFDDPQRLATAAGLVTAGVAFALQRVLTAFAGYVLILRGKTFNVGDRIVMGGVRGDVVALGFMQTTIMEMGQPPSVQNADPAMWVRARQFTGRIVTVSNARVFDEPVFNYTRDFPYLWEEIRVPISYRDDHLVVEQILLDVARRHTLEMAALSEGAVRELERRYVMRRSEMAPRVFVRMTDNWIELAVRFLAEDHGVRELKDAMTRDVLAAFARRGVSVASATFELVGLPPLHIDARESTPPAPDSAAR